MVSVQPQPWPEPSVEVAAAIRAMYGGRRKAPLPVQVRDRLGELFCDAEFARAFGVRGKPGWSPGRLALVTVLQKAQDLTDRQAADAVRDSLPWKYALGLALDDPGFDHSVLPEFRSRVMAHGLEEKVLDLLVKKLLEDGLLAAGGKQRTDSTHIVSAVRDLNRLELVGESVRACLEAVTSAAPHWVDEVLQVGEWSRRYAQRIDTWRLPSAKTKKEELALHYGQDGFTLLGALYAPASPPWLRELPAVQVLRTVLLQNYTRATVRGGREVVKRRGSDIDTEGGLPPGHRRLASPYDTDARRSAKRDTFWLGYKLHVSENCTAPGSGSHGPTATGRPATVDTQRPNLITNVTTTDATVPDTRALTPIHQSLKRRGLLPAEHYLDSGYPSAALLVESAKTFGVALITPVLLDNSRQAKENNGFATHDFTLDFNAERATCPAGQESASWSPCTQAGVERIVVTFARDTCRPCPMRSQCTTSAAGRRQLSVNPREMSEAIALARAQQETKDWRKDYALRAGVEGTIRQATDVTGLRRARYRGLAKTHLDHVTSATALNLIRLVAWWNGRPLDRGHTSHLARLELSLAT